MEENNSIFKNKHKGINNSYKDLFDVGKKDSKNSYRNVYKNFLNDLDLREFNKIFHYSNFYLENENFFLNYDENELFEFYEYFLKNIYHIRCIVKGYYENEDISNLNISYTIFFLSTLISGGFILNYVFNNMIQEIQEFFYNKTFYNKFLHSFTKNIEKEITKFKISDTKKEINNFNNEFNKNLKYENIDKKEFRKLIKLIFDNKDFFSENMWNNIHLFYKNFYKINFISEKMKQELYRNPFLVFLCIKIYIIEKNNNEFLQSELINAREKCFLKFKKNETKSFYILNKIKKISRENINKYKSDNEISFLRNDKEFLKSFIIKIFDDQKVNTSFFSAEQFESYEYERKKFLSETFLNFFFRWENLIFQIKKTLIDDLKLLKFGVEEKFKNKLFLSEIWEFNEKFKNNKTLEKFEKIFNKKRHLSFYINKMKKEFFEKEISEGIKEIEDALNKLNEEFSKLKISKINNYENPNYWFSMKNLEITDNKNKNFIEYKKIILFNKNKINNNYNEIQLKEIQKGNILLQIRRLLSFVQDVKDEAYKEKFLKFEKAWNLQNKYKIIFTSDYFLNNSIEKIINNLKENKTILKINEEFQNEIIKIKKIKNKQIQLQNFIKYLDSINKKDFKTKFFMSSKSEKVKIKNTENNNLWNFYLSKRKEIKIKHYVNKDFPNKFENEIERNEEINNLIKRSKNNIKSIKKYSFFWIFNNEYFENYIYDHQNSREYKLIKEEIKRDIEKYKNKEEYEKILKERFWKAKLEYNTNNFNMFFFENANNEEEYISENIDTYFEKYKKNKKIKNKIHYKCVKVISLNFKNKKKLEESISKVLKSKDRSKIKILNNLNLIKHKIITKDFKKYKNDLINKIKKYNNKNIFRNKLFGEFFSFSWKEESIFKLRNFDTNENIIFNVPEKSESLNLNMNVIDKLLEVNQGNKFLKMILKKNNENNNEWILKERKREYKIVGINYKFFISEESYQNIFVKIKNENSNIKKLFNNNLDEIILKFDNDFYIRLKQPDILMKTLIKK